MKIVALTEKNQSPAIWWRITQPYTFLRKKGIDAQLCWLDLDENPTLDIRDAVVVLPRTLIKGGVVGEATAWVERLRGLGAKKIVYELDDDTLSDDYVAYLTGCGRITESSKQIVALERARQLETIQACDAITVSTRALGNVVRNYATNTAIHVIPNMIPVKWFESKLAPHIDWGEKIITIGWAGGLRPAEDFTAMAQAWGRIAQAYPHVRFVVAGYQAEEIYKHVPFESIVRIPWTILDEWPKSMQVDIGCCTLENTPFNQCKSAIKAFEYGLAGATVVGTKTVYGDMITNRVSGMVVENIVEEWYIALSVLIENKGNIRSALGHYWHAQIKKYCSLEENWNNWSDAYQLIHTGYMNKRKMKVTR